MIDDDSDALPATEREARAAKLAELADLHKAGVLSNAALESATARVMSVDVTPSDPAIGLAPPEVAATVIEPERHPERLAQLADVHRQEVLSDEELEAAVARVSENTTSPPPRPDKQSDRLGGQHDQGMVVIGREVKRMAEAGVAQLRLLQQQVGTRRSRVAASVDPGQPSESPSGVNAKASPPTPDAGDRGSSLERRSPPPRSHGPHTRRIARWMIPVGVTVIVAVGAAAWMTWRNVSSSEVQVTLTVEMGGWGCGVPDENWGWLTFTTSDGIRTQAVMDDGNVVSESPCWIARHYRVPLKAGEVYQVKLELAGPPGTVDEGSVVFESPLTEVTPDDYSDGHIDITHGSDGVTIS